MRRKLLPLFIGLVLVVVGLAYLFNKEAADSKEAIVIFGEDSSNLKAYTTLKSAFTAKTGIAAKFEGAPFEESVQKALADFKYGKANYDIVLQYNFTLAAYVRNNYVAPISDVFSPTMLRNLGLTQDTFKAAVEETCFYYSDPKNLTSTPKQFGFPFAANTMLLVYNKDLFEDPVLRKKYKDQCGKDLLPPTEWKDYLEVSEFFARTDSKLKGVCMQGASGGWLYYEICNYLFGMGTGTSSKQHGWEEGARLTIATPSNEEVLRYCKRLQLTSAGNFFNVDAPEQQKIMLEGRTAMALIWSDYVQPLTKSQTVHFGFAPTPGRLSGLAGGAFYINRKSRRLQSASQFVLFALSRENQSDLIEKGLCSALRPAYTEQVMAKVPYARALRDSLERGVFMFEAGTDAELINTAITTWIQRYMRGEVSESEALKQAENEIYAKRANLQ